MNNTTHNRYGLSRTIPRDVKRKIRQECGFGCVVCGNAIYEYEHIDPPFANAKSHDSDKMALLCGACHGYVTRKFWSKQKIIEARCAPWSIKNGHAHFLMDASSFAERQIKIGKTLLIDPDETVISAFGEPVLIIRSPEDNNSPIRVSALFRNTAGEIIFQIDDNEVSINEDSWDVNTEGGRVIVRERSRKIALQLVVNPDSIFEIQKLDMMTLGGCIKASINKSDYSIVLYGANGSYSVIGAEGATIKHSISIGKNYAHIGRYESREKYLPPVNLWAEPVSIIRTGTAVYCWHVNHKKPLPANSKASITNLPVGVTCKRPTVTICDDDEMIEFEIFADSTAELGYYPGVKCVVSFGSYRFPSSRGGELSVL